MHSLLLDTFDKYHVAEAAAVASVVIPDPEPPPLSEQPESVQEIFESRASGRDVTPEELYEKVPDNLKNNPDEVTAYVEGSEAAGTEPRDVSRHQSGHNGGEYTDENTSWERSSDNRSAQEADMTPERQSQMEADNAADADVIESAYSEDVYSTGADILEAEPTALGFTANAVEQSDGMLDIASELLSDALAPATAAYLAVREVTKRCDNEHDMLMYGSYAGVAAAAFACTPVGAACLGAYAGGRLCWTGFKLVKRYHHRVVPVAVRVFS